MQLSGVFTPLASSVYGTLAPESELVLHRVTKMMKHSKEEKTDVSFLHRVALQTAIIRATSLCLRARSAATLPECRDVPAPRDPGSAFADAGLRVSDL